MGYFLLILLMAEAGRAGEPARCPPAAESAVSVSSAAGRIEGFPDVIQTNDYSCGVAAVQGVLQFYGISGYQDAYAKALGTTRKEGTHPARMAAYLRKRGLDAKLVECMSLADLKRYVDEGVPVIVDFQAWHEPPKKDYSEEWEDGHYGIVVGYDGTDLFIEDPSLLGSVGRLSMDDFLKRWHDYENEGKRRRMCVRMGIVVRGKRVPAAPFTPIE